MLQRRWAVALLLVGAIAGWPAVAGAVPITYLDTLSSGVPVFGTNDQAPANQNNPVGADYYQFFATSGSAVTVTGIRLAGFYDMSFWLFSGLFTDTDDFGASFDSGDAPFADFADDELFPAIPGPFGDPQSVFFAPATGWYTVAVTNFLSASGGPPNPYSLVAGGVDNVPEPGTLLLIGSGLAGLAMRRRRQARRD
jgi:hypothetical protein